MGISKQRTQEELDDIEYNYFRYYGIKPSETDANAIKAIILKKASDTNPKNPRLARELLDDAKAIMIEDAVFDPTSNSYVPNSKGRALEWKALKDKSLDDAASYVQNSSKSKKIVFYSLIQKITESSKNIIAGENIFTFDELLNRVKYLEKQGFQFIDETKADPFSAFEGLDQYFTTCGVDNLYEYLGVDKDASRSEIDAGLAKKKTEWAKLSTADRNRKNAYSKLNGKVPLILQSDDQRKMYDYYIAFYEDIWSKLKAKKQYNDFELDFDDFTSYVSQIQNDAKVSLAEATQIMAIGLHHFSLNLVGGNEDDGLSTCPHCGKLYQKGLKVCPHCGKNLEILCWNCATPIPIEAKTCPHCGVSRALEMSFNKAKSNLDAALLLIPIDDMNLESCLLSLKNVYSKYDQTKGCKIQRTVEEYTAKVQKRKQEKEKIDAIFDEYATKVVDFCGRKKFVKASGVLIQLKNKLPTYDVKKYEMQIQSALNNAKLLLSSAQRKLSLKDMKGGLLDISKALDVCNDYTEALNLLKAYPPDAPISLSVTCDKEGAHLRWNGQADSTITYTILRKTGIAPKGDDDGEVVASDLTLNEYIDSSLISGVPTYYAVYADRRGVHSKLTVSNNVALTFLNISNVHQEIKDGCIKVAFKRAEGSKDILIRMKEGSLPPISLKDGKEIKPDKNFFEVDDVQVASFFIVSEYEVNGKKQYSEALKCTYRKTNVPKELKVVSTSNKGNNMQFLIEFEPIGEGLDIELYQSEECYDFEFGVADENVNFQKKFKKLVKTDFMPGENKIIYEMKPDSLIWLYPVVKNSTLYVLCKPLLANSILGLQAINIVANEGNIKIEGQLHPKARNLIALVSSISFPQILTDKDCIKRVCSKADFERQKGMSFNLTPGIYYITLFAEFVENSQTFYSSALPLPKPISCKKKTALKYALETDIDLYHPKKVKISFKSSIPGKVPACELYCGFPRPQSKGNGILLGRLPSGELKKKLFKPDYYYSATFDCHPLTKKGDKVALFFTEDDDDEFYLMLVDKI